MAFQYRFKIPGANLRPRIAATILVLFISLYLFSEIQSAPSPTGQAIKNSVVPGALTKAADDDALSNDNPVSPESNSTLPQNKTIIDKLLGFFGGGGSSGGSSSGKGGDDPQPEPAAPEIKVKANTREIPAEFWGTVAINGAPAKDGLSVEAKIGGDSHANTTTYHQGYYKIIVSADDNNTIEKEGGVSGDKITVFINGQRAAPDLTWSAGIFRADLTA